MIDLNFDFKGAIFDLDGVIVDTAKYHYLAWKSLADELGFEFTKQHNEKLKGISRRASLEELLKVGNISFSEDKKLEMMEQKNKLYIELVKQMDETEILDGAMELLVALRKKGIKIALGSASKNTAIILEKLKIVELFDVIVNGIDVKNSKPDPEVFLLGAERMGLKNTDCVVFEDAFSGIEAAKRAGMTAIGIGDASILTNADDVVEGLCSVQIM